MPYKYKNSLLDRVGEKAALSLAILCVVLSVTEVVLFVLIGQLLPANAPVPTAGLPYELACAFVIIACVLPVVVVLFTILLLCILYAEQKFYHDHE